MTALVRSTLRTLTREAASPSEAMRELNDAMVRQTTDERYCTLVSAVVQPHNDGLQMTMCLGGHHPPLLRRSDGTVEPTGRPGPRSVCSMTRTCMTPWSTSARAT